MRDWFGGKRKWSIKTKGKKLILFCKIMNIYNEWGDFISKRKGNEFGESCKKKINAKGENYFDFVKQLKTFILL